MLTRDSRYVAMLLQQLLALQFCVLGEPAESALCVDDEFGAARARHGQFWRWILTEVGVAVGQHGSTDRVLCFERVPAWSVVWVLAGDIGQCRGWLLCSSSA
jgi:hypothetical protein